MDQRKIAILAVGALGLAVKLMFKAAIDLSWALTAPKPTPTISREESERRFNQQMQQSERQLDEAMKAWPEPTPSQRP